MVQLAKPQKSNQDPKKNKDPKPVTVNPGFHISTGESSAARLPIGYPSVELYFSNEALAGSIPIMYLIPGQGQFTAGLDVFEFDDKLNIFKDMLQDDYDIVLKTQSNCIPIAFLPEAIPGIQLSNDYGASFLENITNVGGPLLGQLAQMSGATNLGSLTQRLPGQLGGAVAGEKGKDIGKWISEKIGGVVSGIAGIGEGLLEASPLSESMKTGARNIVSSGVSVVGAMLTGARVDFPKVWMGSGFSGPVSIPIRLYNPDQTSEVSYSKYIIEPLTILLMLGAPLSDQDNLYRWPYIHRIWCPGLFKWKMASVVGLTVQPGPENQMSWNNRPSMIDVRIDFQPLHSVMLGRRTSSSVPSVGDYIDQLRTSKIAPRLWQVPAGAPNVSTWTSGTAYDEDIFEVPGTPTSTVNTDDAINPPERVSEVDKDVYDKILAEQRAKGINPAAERLQKERQAQQNQIIQDNLNQAKQTQEAADYDNQTAAQKTVADKQLQEQLVTTDSTLSALPETQANQIANTSSGPSQDEIADAADGKIAVPEGVAYIQDEYGSVPGDSKNVPKELPEGGKAPGQSDSFWGGVSSKLSATGTAVIAAGRNIATSVVDGASYKARQVSDTIEKITGKSKDSGQEIKTTVSKPTTVEEVRKADTFPTTSEETVKEQSEPIVAASQQSMQARSSEIAAENQSYTSQLQVWNSLLEKTTDPSIRAYAQTRINLLKTNHESNLTIIENKYN
jgi:hypothetical protein